MIRLRYPRIPPGTCPRYFWPIDRVGVACLDIPVPAWASVAAWHRLLASWPREWAA